MAEEPSNFIPKDQEARDALYDKSVVRGLVEGDAWGSMSPNYKRNDALQPSEVQADTVIALVDQVIVQEAHTMDQIALGKGILRPMENGSGESKRSFIYEVDGKRMVVKVYDGSNAETQIPEDPRSFHAFTRYEGSGLMQYDEYSDLRTYLQVGIKHPDGTNQSVLFQEYGGTLHVDTLTSLRKPIAKTRVTRAMAKRGMVCVDKHEFNHDRHYLTPEGRFGPVAVIDVLFKGQAKNKQHTI